MSQEYTPLGHHLLNAYLAWFYENKIAKVHVLANVSTNGSPFVRGLGDSKGTAVLNLGPMATKDLLIDSTGISFKARFSGVEHHLFFKLNDLIAISLPIGKGSVNIALTNYHEIMATFGLIEKSQVTPTPPTPIKQGLRVVK